MLIGATMHFGLVSLLSTIDGPFSLFSASARVSIFPRYVCITFMSAKLERILYQ